MWAGGRASFERPLRVGEAIRPIPTIRSIDSQSKSGKNGPLIFVTARQEVLGSFGGALSEDVYREGPNFGKPSPAKPRARTHENWRRDTRRSVCGAPSAAGDGAELWARSATGALAMQAEARFRSRDEQP